MRYIHDPRTRFSGANFQIALHTPDVHNIPTRVKNPQANAICKRMHKTCGDMICTFLQENPPNNIKTTFKLVNLVLATAQCTLGICVQRTFRISPGHQDMLLPIPVLTD
jgi:hypothetical protein